MEHVKKIYVYKSGNEFIVIYANHMQNNKVIYQLSLSVKDAVLGMTW